MVKLPVVLAIALGVIGIGLVGAWWAGGNDVGCRARSVDEADYVQGNDALLKGLPMYPGARLAIPGQSIGQPASDSCLPHENGPPYDSFMTTTVYRLPDGATPKQVIDFYDRELVGEWEQVIVRGLSNTCEVSYRRGEELLGVKACDENLVFKIIHATPT